MMNAQMKLPFEDFDGAATAANDNQPTDKWQTKFEEFDEANPHVYALVVRYALEVLASGKKRIGINTIFERIRWYTDIETRGEPFKIGQNHFPYYARMFMRDYPQHDGFFAIRALGRKGPRK